MRGSDDKHEMTPRNKINQQDHRGNVWWVVDVTPDEQAAWETIRIAWATATDAEIADAKSLMLKTFPAPVKHDEVKGMACSDFIYLFSEAQDRHFFVPTNKTEKAALYYHCQGTGQADMAFAPHCTYATVKWRHWEPSPFHTPSFKVHIPDTTAYVPFEPDYHRNNR